MTPRIRILFWVIVAAQIAFLVGFIAVREVDLRTGTEVVLQTVPVDPRSLLQGDYAILDYEIATTPERMRPLQTGDTVYVTLQEGEDTWTAERYSITRGDAGNVFIKGRIDRALHLGFGIDTYFVPEGTGHIIEDADDVQVIVSIDRDGNAVIKDVLVDGEPFADRAAEAE